MGRRLKTWHLHGRPGAAADRPWLPWAVLLCSTLLWAVPLYFSFFGLTLDLDIHYRWAAQFERSLQEGVWIPRWNDMAHGGLGDATFLHIHPLFYYLVAAADALVHDLWTALRLVVALSQGALGIAVYLAAKKLFGRERALLCGVAAQWMPMAVFQLLYAQSFPVLLAWPFAAMAVGQVAAVRYDGRAALRCSLALACTILSHVLVGLMVMVCVSVVLVVLAFLAQPEAGTLVAGPRGARAQRALRWLGSVTLALGLSAWYLVPAVLGRALISPAAWVLGNAQAPTLSWQRNFIFPWLTTLQEGSTNLILLWLVPLPAALLIALAAWACWRQRQTLAGPASTDDATGRAGATAVSLQAVTGIGLAALLFATGLSWPVWALSGSFQQLQFPWRFVNLMAIAAALLLGHRRFGQRLPGLRLRLWVLATLPLVGVSVLLAGLALQGGKRVEPDARWLTGDFGQPEYLPATVPGDWQNALATASRCGDKDAGCTLEANGSHAKRFAVSAAADGHRLLPSFFHPGWEVKLDGVHVDAQADARTGLIRVAVPRGAHGLTQQWRGTGLEAAGLALTAFSLLAAALWMGWPGWRRERPAHR